MFVEMAEALAGLAMKEPKEAAAAKFIFRRCLIREPTATELAATLAFYRAQHTRFQNGELTAKTFLKTKQPTPELAAWTRVARAIFNLDEMVTKE